jgi:Circularly permutated YpsA SLOG family
LLKRPYVLVDARQVSESEAVAAVAEFVEKNGIETLNVAGPRLSGWAEGYAFALAVVGGVIRNEG